MTDPAIALIESLEWAGSDGFGAPICPSCRVGKDEKHAPDCRMHAILTTVNAPMDDMAVAQRLCAFASMHSKTRKEASVRLMKAASTLAVTEGASLTDWMRGAVHDYEMVSALYKVNRAEVRKIAGLGIIEAVADA